MFEFAPVITPEGKGVDTGVDCEVELETAAIPAPDDREAVEIFNGVTVTAELSGVDTLDAEGRLMLVGWWCGEEADELTEEEGAEGVVMFISNTIAR